MSSNIIKIWENWDSCADQYIFAKTLYLLSVLSHDYDVIIGSVFGAPDHGWYVVDGLNAT